MKNLHEATRKFLREEDGVTAIEYGLIAALIAVVIIASVALIGNNLNQIFKFIGDTLTNALPSAGS
jgi:pilus assembly protein Flp/PilA